jgi:hypothetical protein
MSGTLDKIGAAPESRSAGFWLLLFGASAAPIFWLGQVMLGYAVTAYACYPGDHPAPLASGSVLGGILAAFDIVAAIAAASGGVVALWCWRRVQHKREEGHFDIGAGRARFLALWGIFSSLWFFCAILFNTIASLTVPPCLT